MDSLQHFAEPEEISWLGERALDGDDRTGGRINPITKQIK